jgi:hypothetical protein
MADREVPKSSKSAVKISEVLCSDVKWNGAVGKLNGVKPNERVVKCSSVKFKWEEVKCSEVEWIVVGWSAVKVLVTGCLSLLEDIYITWSLLFIRFCVYRIPSCLTKPEHGPHSSQLVNCVVLCIVWVSCVVLCIVWVSCVVLCIVCVEMRTVLLPPGVNPIAVKKYIISYHISYHIITSYHISYHIIT